MKPLTLSSFGVVALCLLAAAACGDDPSNTSSSGNASGGSGNASGGSGSASGGASGVGGSSSSGGGTSATGGGSASGGGGSGGGASADCAPLPASGGTVVEVGPSDDVQAAVANAQPGTTILLQDGQYDMSGKSLWIDQDNITIRSKSGNAEAVVLDGGYDTPTGGLISISNASDVTIAHITLRRPRYHAIHVTAGNTNVTGTLIYGVRAFDPGEQTIKINHGDPGVYPDAGEVACSHMELTEPGRQQVMQYTSSGSNCYTGGIDAHDARDWLVRDNTIVGFYCTNGDLAEHGIHFWTGSRDTQVLRNRLIDNARGIGFGLVGGGRTYSDDPCPGVSDAGHYGGLIANNVISASDNALFSSPNGMDLGIGLWYACGATVVHNSVASTQAPFSSIEWRFSQTDVRLYNNLVSHNLRERNGATAVQEGNLEGAAVSEWLDAAGHDLHLDPSANAVGQGGPLGAALAPQDIDGDARPAQAPDVGADQRR